MCAKKLTRIPQQYSTDVGTFLSQQQGGTEHLFIGFRSDRHFLIRFGNSDAGLEYDFDSRSDADDWMFWCVVVTDNGASTTRHIYTTSYNGYYYYESGYLNTDNYGHYSRTDSNKPRYTGSGDLFIGHGLEYTFSSGTQIDDLHFFNRALSSSEVQQIRTNDDGLDRSGLFLLFRFHRESHLQEPWAWAQYAQNNHEVAVSTSLLLDESGKGNNADIVGSGLKVKVLPRCVSCSTL